MSQKYNTGKGGKKAKNYGSKGGGMARHAKSGVAHNHANSIAMAREAAKDIEAQAKLKKIREGKLFPSVKEALNDKSYA